MRLAALAVVVLVGCTHQDAPSHDTDTDADPGPDTDVVDPQDTAGPPLEDTGDWPDVSTPPPTGLCSADGWCWVDPALHGVDLFDVAGTGADDVWAVGAAGLVQHRDAAGWTATLLDVAADLHAVLVDAPGAPCVAGDDAVVRCLEAGAWVDVGPRGVHADLRALGRAKGGHLWAAGPEGVFERTGEVVSPWRTHAVQGSLLAVLADDDVWVGEVGDDLLWHWNGRSWAFQRLSAPVQDLDGTPTAGAWALAGNHPWHLDDLGDGVVAFVVEEDVTLDRFFDTPWLRVLPGGTVVAQSSLARLVHDDEGWTSVALPTPTRIGASGWGPTADRLWLVGSGGTVARWDGAVFTDEGSPFDHDRSADRDDRRAWGILTPDPRGGVIHGTGWAVPHGLLRREGGVARPLRLPEPEPAVTSLVADGPRLWATFAVGPDVPPVFALDLVGTWRSRAGLWHGRFDDLDVVAPSAAREHVWRARPGRCDFTERDTRGEEGPAWPPPFPGEPAFCVGADLEVFAPGERVAWARRTGTEAVWTEIWAYDADGWRHGTVTDDVRPARHPVTGELVLVTTGAGVGDWDGGERVRGARRLGKGDVVGPILSLPGELVVQVRDGDRGRVRLLRWDGEATRSEALPTDHPVARLVREADGRTWASAGDDLFVLRP